MRFLDRHEQRIVVEPRRGEGEHTLRELLRALETGEVLPVGASKPRAADVRVVSATHRPLEELIKRGQFREDLFWRLNVLPLWIPPLRERVDDIAPLATRFAREAGQGFGRGDHHFDRRQVDVFLRGKVGRESRCGEEKGQNCENWFAHAADAINCARNLLVPPRFLAAGENLEDERNYLPISTEAKAAIAVPMISGYQTIGIIALEEAKIVVAQPATLVTLGDLKQWPAILCLLGFVVIVALNYRNVVGGTLIGILVVSFLGLPLGLAQFSGVVAPPPSLAPGRHGCRQ